MVEGSWRNLDPGGSDTFFVGSCWIRNPKGGRFCCPPLFFLLSHRNKACRVRVASPRPFSKGSSQEWTCYRPYSSSCYCCTILGNWQNGLHSCLLLSLFSFHWQLGLDMEELEEIEEDAGLGNGGLGRLAGKWHYHHVRSSDAFWGARYLEDPDRCPGRRARYNLFVHVFVVEFALWFGQL